jgi:hypothetical protein
MALGEPEVFEAELDKQAHVVRARALSRLTEAFPSVFQEVVVTHDAYLCIHDGLINLSVCLRVWLFPVQKANAGSRAHQPGSRLRTAIDAPISHNRTDLIAGPDAGRCRHAWGQECVQPYVMMERSNSFGEEMPSRAYACLR